VRGFFIRRLVDRLVDERRLVDDERRLVDRLVDERRLVDDGRREARVRGRMHATAPQILGQRRS